MPNQLKKGYKRYSLPLPEELMLYVDQLTERKGITRNQAVLEALQQWIDNE